jgi:hypothetical protein
MQPQQVGIQQVTGHLEPGCPDAASLWQAELAGAVQVAHRAGADWPWPGHDVLRRVVAEGLVPRANEQAAQMAAIINLARAVAVVGLLVLR